jgi:chromate transporter
MSMIDRAEPAPGVPSLLDIFTAFASIALSGFGGVLAWARRGLAERRKWMTPEEFNDLFALAQFLPGPNIVNFSVVYGSRLRGPWGAAAAFLGLLGPPLVIVTLLGMAYVRFSDIDALRRVLSGVSAAAAGVLIGTVAKMAIPMLRENFGPPVVLALLTFLAIGVMRWPMPIALAFLVPLSIGVSWWVRR